MQKPVSYSLAERQNRIKKRILIFSDDSQLSESLSLFFGEEFDVQTFECFEAVRDIVCSGKADLLLVDFGLPENYISQSLCQLRKLGCEIPIVLMYVFHEKKKRQETEMRKYADAVFYKPVNILDVLGQIRLFLS